MSNPSTQWDVVIIGGGLAGLATAAELLDTGLRVLILDRDQETAFGGLAKESFGGVMFVDTPLQRRLGIADSPELAFADWMSFAELGPSDVWPRRWAEKYVEHSIELIYEWLTKRGVAFLPLVNWPERGLYRPGNSVPRWHIAWGTGRAIVEGVLGALEDHPYHDRLEVRFCHCVERLEVTDGVVTGCSGRLEGTDREFSVSAGAVVAAAGGICGGDLSRVKKHWYAPWGDPPPVLLNGSHRFADGTIHDSAAAIGGHLTHLDHQWHYAAGVHHPRPDRPAHGLSLVPPRSALWMNATGRRIGPQPLVGYTDTRYLVEQILRQPGGFSWQVMNAKIAAKELAVSGSEYMTAFTEKSKLRLVRDLLLGNRELVERLCSECKDVVTGSSIPELAGRMNELETGHRVDPELLEREIRTYDTMIDRGQRYHNDDQLRRIASSRTYRGDRIRTCKFQKIDDEKARPLIAIREFILSRKSLGGLQTDLESRVLNVDGQPIPGLFAVGETAGFGGGGIHGRGSLEGTFLGSCILTGRLAGRAIAGGAS